MNKDVSIKPAGKPGEQRLSAEEMLEVLELVKGSTSIELKLTVPDQSHGDAIKRLGFDPVDAEPRQTYFFDTPDLALNKAGVVVRARRSPGGKADTVVKLRPVDPANLDPELRREHGFKIELDAMPGGYVCSASLKGICTAQEVIGVAGGNLSLTSIFSKKQRAFYSAHAPADVSMNELVPLGPTFLLRARHFPKGYDRRVTVELWLYPDGSRILEISTKAQPEEAFQAAIQFRAFIVKCGIPLEKQSVTKTSSALEYFSRRINGQRPAGASMERAD
jgi:hypothetical protein